MTGSDKTSAVSGILAELCQLLESVSEKHWSNRIKAVLEGRSNPADVSTWFGGMGSLDDLVLSPVNGHNLPAERTDALLEQFDSLRRDLFESVRS